MFFSFLRLLVRCWRMALPYGRLKLFGVLGLILFNGLLQLVGVSSVFPFFALAAAPDRIRNSRVGGWLLHFLPPMSTNHLLVLAGCFAIAMLVFASVGSVLSENLRIRYAYGFCHWLRGRLFESYASQPYAFFLRRNTAELNQRLLDIQTFIQSVLLPVGEILTRLVIVLLMVGGIFVVQPWVALGATLVFGGFYFLIFLWLRPRTRAVGEGLQRHNLGFWKNTGQFLQGIKTVLVHGKSRHFMDRALEHSSRIGFFQSRMPIYGNGPRYMIEPVAFGGLMAIVVVLAFRGRPFSDILPNLSVMAFAGYRLLPTLQLLYSQLVTVAANKYTLTQLEEEILNHREGNRRNSGDAAEPASDSATRRLQHFVSPTACFSKGTAAGKHHLPISRRHRARAEGFQPRHRQKRIGGRRRPVWFRQIHARGFDPGPTRPAVRRHASGRRAAYGRQHGLLAADDWLRATGHLSAGRHHRGEHRLWRGAEGDQIRRHCGRRPWVRKSSTLSKRNCRRDFKLRSASGACGFPAGNASASGWPAPCITVHRC